MKVLVTGGSGFVGRHLVPRLLADGFEVRVLARRAPTGAQAFEYVRGDVTEPASLPAALAGVDAVVHLVAVILERGRYTFDSVNRRGTESLLHAAAESGVSRFVHLSALGAGPDARFPYLRSRWLAEEAVRASRLDWTVLRPSVLHGDGAGFFRPIVWTLRWMPVYPMVAGGRTRFQPLAVQDLAVCVSACLRGEADARRSIDLGGPEVLTFADIVHTVMRALGKRRRILPVPVWAARPFAFLQQLRREPLVTNGQLDMVVLDNTAALDSVEREFGFAPQRFQTADLRWLATLLEPRSRRR
jgi:NADH dehydrogenase